MADFVQTMKDWRRMCKAYTTDDDSCCYGCPVVDFHEHGCGAIFEMDDGTDWERYEGQIREWAAEHPVEYPYMIDVLQDVFNMPNGLSPMNIWEWINTIRIPDDIAQKLGLQPKEGV